MTVGNRIRLKNSLTQKSSTSYEPVLTRGTIVAGASQTLKYNHDSSLIYFGDRWFCLWNASPDLEAVGPQSILSATSKDFVSWTTPVPCFSNSNFATNPVPVTSPVLQWQPGTIVIDGTLHALWMNEGASDGSNGTYVSRLKSVDGKWSNEKLGVAPATINGTLYEQAFITGDPVELGSGRILCPVIFQSRSVTVPLPGGVTSSEFFTRAKLAGVLYSDDRGASWNRGGLVTVAGAEGCVWEPFISLRADGQVRLFVRNLYAEQATTLMLYTATSSDGGTTFSSLTSTNMETISSRGTIVNRPLNEGPSVMVLNDNVKKTTPSSKVDRRALSLWLSSDGDNYIPGTTVSDDLLDNAPCYPTARLRDGKLYIVYSTSQRSNGNPSDLRTITIDPAPSYRKSNKRANATGLISPVITTTPYKSFKNDYLTKMASVTTTSALWTNQVSLSILARFENTASCALIDNRPSSNDAGFLVTMNDVVSVGVFNGTTLTTTSSGLSVPIDKDAYIGISIDGVAGTATVYVVADGTAITNTISYGFTPAALNSPEKLYMGCARLISTLLSPKGVIRFVKAYQGAMTINQHRYVQNAVATTLSLPLWTGTTTAPPATAIDYDAASLDAGTNNGTWLSLFDATGKSNGYIVTAGNSATIHGNASISLKSKNVNQYLLRYTPIAGQLSPIIIATIGDGTRYAEITRAVDNTISIKISDNGSITTTVIGTSDTAIQNITINVGSSLTINHSSCDPFVTATLFSNIVYAGKAYGVTYLAPENSFSINI